ncbi:MAG: DUF4417 domain-containing protein [Methanotrichaceae archaeon]
MSECPDALFPSSNPEGIPDLLKSMEADFVDVPIPWGSVRRYGGSGYQGRTISFYVSDERFAALGNAVEYGSHFRQLWERCDAIWKSGAPSFCEVNFSTSNALPRAHALWQIYKKRYLSRYFQKRGMRCFADLNVSSKWQELNLLGVPLGYRAFSTKIHRSTSLQELTDQAAYAESIRGSDDLLFLVVANRSEVESLCKKCGWVYVDEGKSAVWSKRQSNKTRSLQAEKPRIQSSLFNI